MPSSSQEEALKKIEDQRNILKTAGLTDSEIDAIYDAHVARRERNNVLKERRANIDVQDMGGQGNNCFLFSIGCDAAGEANNLREALYDAYRKIFAFKPTIANQTEYDRLRGDLKQKFEVEPGEGDFTLENCTKPGRMLNLADFNLIARLLGRQIHIVTKGGAVERLGPSGIMSTTLMAAIGLQIYADQPTQNDDINRPLYAQKQDHAHYHRVTEVGMTELAEVAAEQSKEKSNYIDDPLIEKAVNEAIQAHSSQADAIMEYSRILESQLPLALSAPAKPGPAPEPFNDTTPPVAPIIAEQVSDLLKARTDIEAKLKDPKIATGVPDTFIADLEKLHRQHDAQIRHLKSLKEKGTAKSVKDVLFSPAVGSAAPALNSKMVDPAVRGERATSLFYGLFRNGEDAERDNFYKQIRGGQVVFLGDAFDKMLPAFTGALEASKALGEYNAVLQKIKTVKMELEGIELDLETNAQEIRLANLGSKNTSGLQSEENVLKKKKEEKKNELDTLLLQRRFLGLKSPGLSISEQKLLTSKNDSEIINAAFKRFQQHLTTLKAQQDNWTADVINPLDVQLAAIVLQRTIVVVNANGERHSFSPDIFTAEDLKQLSSDAMREACQKNFLNALGVAHISIPHAVQLMYVYNNGMHAYQTVTRAGATQLNAVELLIKTELDNAEGAIRRHKSNIETHLGSLGNKVSPAIAEEVQAYSTSYAAVLASSGTGAVPSIPAASPAKLSWKAKFDNATTVSITAAEANLRDIHRQNIDTLLTLLLQGTRTDKQLFDASYQAAIGPSLINLDINKYSPLFENAPTFYAKNLTYPLFPSLTGKTEEERIKELIKLEINAYLDLKKSSPDSALAQDYKAILIALEMGLLAQNSVISPVVEGIHERVASKASYVANMIDSNAYEGKFGADHKQQHAIREGIHHYRQAVKKEPQTPLAPNALAPKQAHSLKQTSYSSDTAKTRIVFDVKGMTMAEVMAAFNDVSRDAALTVKNDKDVDCRIVAKKEGGRLKLILQDAEGKEDPLTKSVWNSKGAGAAVEKALKEIAAVDADLSSAVSTKPRMR